MTTPSRFALTPLTLPLAGRTDASTGEIIGCQNLAGLNSLLVNRGSFTFAHVTLDDCDPVVITEGSPLLTYREIAEAAREAA